MTSIPDWVSAAILVGGSGTRLRSVVADRPKPLAVVAGRPFVCNLLDQLVAAGVEQVTLLTGYRGEQVREQLGARYGSLALDYSQEPQPLGTGGAVRHALDGLTGEAVLLLNGDSYCELDLVSFWSEFQRHRTVAALALTRVQDSGRFGRVDVQADGVVTGFREKQPNPQPGWINAGVYLLSRPLLEALPYKKVVSLERDCLPGWVDARKVCGFCVEGAFLDIGTPESYAAAEHFFARLSERKGGFSGSVRAEFVG